MSPDVVASAIAKTYSANSLPSASQHFCGSGSHEGVDFDLTLQFLRSMKDEIDADYIYKAAFETIITGAAWPSPRVRAAYPSVSALCSRCTHLCLPFALGAT